MFKSVFFRINFKIVCINKESDISFKCSQLIDIRYKYINLGGNKMKDKHTFKGL